MSRLLLLAVSQTSPGFYVSSEQVFSSSHSVFYSTVFLFYFQIWNEAVAMAASEWGTECEYVPRSDNQWGQNMNYFYGRDYHMPGLDMFSNSFTSWSNNTVNNEYRQYRFCGPDNPCSYSQVRSLF